MREINFFYARIKRLFLGTILFLIGMGLLTLIRPGVQASINPKVKTMTTLALYGTAGGALLGTATMAFGNGTRAIFQGASLGLYAGLLFGGYVLITHHYKSKKQAGESYPGGARGIYQGDDDETYSDDSDNRWAMPPNAFQEFWDNKWRARSRERGRSTSLYLDFWQLQF